MKQSQPDTKIGEDLVVTDSTSVLGNHKVFGQSSVSTNLNVPCVGDTPVTVNNSSGLIPDIPLNVGANQLAFNSHNNVEFDNLANCNTIWNRRNQGFKKKG